MANADFDELAGRIEGISQAVLHLAALVEMHAVIDGPRYSAMLMACVPEHTAHTALRRTARKTLQSMALALDDARNARQARFDE